LWLKFITNVRTDKAFTLKYIMMFPPCQAAIYSALSASIKLRLAKRI